MLEINTNFPIIGVADSAIGGRSENQDDWGYCNAPIGCMILVCDGMGGGPGGKTASGIAKRIFLQEVFTASADADPIIVLQNATASANEEIFEQMRLNPSLQGMGSTFVGVLFTHKAAYTVHCGDSRLYKLRRHSVLFRTNDHSLVGQMVRNKTLTEEQARLSPQSNVITRALGNNGNACPDISVIPYEQGDRIILCTDGVWGIMPQKELIKQFTQKLPPASICEYIQRLVDNLGATQKGNKHDNHTIAVIDIQTDSKIKEKMSRNTRIIFFSLLAILFISIIFNILLLCKKPRVIIEQESSTIDNSEIYHSDIKPEDSVDASTTYEANDYNPHTESIEDEIEAETSNQVSYEEEYQEGNVPEEASQTEQDDELRKLNETQTSSLSDLKAKLEEYKNYNFEGTYENACNDVENKRTELCRIIESINIGKQEKILEKMNKVDKKNHPIISLICQPNSTKDIYELTQTAKNQVDSILILISQ